MTYIRIGSNPEGLYIWGDGKDVWISIAGQKEMRTIPRTVFHGLINLYKKNGHEDCDFEDASIKETIENNECRTVLSYKPWASGNW